MSNDLKDAPAWLRYLTRFALIVSVVLAAAGLVDPNNFNNPGLSFAFVVFVLILVGLALDVVVVALTLRLVAKPNRRSNLPVGVIACVVLFLPLIWTIVESVPPA